MSVEDFDLQQDLQPAYMSQASFRGPAGAFGSVSLFIAAASCRTWWLVIRVAHAQGLCPL